MKRAALIIGGFILGIAILLLVALTKGPGAINHYGAPMFGLAGIVGAGLGFLASLFLPKDG